MTVFDASVLVKVFFDEAGSEAAEQAIFAEGIHRAPELAQIEVITAICRRVQRGETTREAALDRVIRWNRILDRDVLVLEPDATVLTRATELSLALLHPLPDCLYLALAQHHNMPLLTADRKFRDKACSIKHPIELLAGCEGS